MSTTALWTVKDNWVDTNASQITTDTISMCWYEHHYPWIQPISIHTSTPSRPIRLTLDEVDTLRAAAKTDPVLRAILRKFTPQIEVEMTL